MIADLRIALATCVIVLACLALLTRLPNAALALAGAFVLALPRIQWRRLLHLETFVALLLVMLPFTMPGTPAFTLGPFDASVEGITRGALIACKVTASALILMALLGRVDLARLGAALSALRVPAGLVRIFVLTPGFLGLIRAEAWRLREAMRARAFRPGTNLRTWRAYGNLLGMLLVRALGRAARVEEAMRCRGFSGHFPHQAFATPTLRDRLIAIGLGLGAAGLLLLDRS